MKKERKKCPFCGGQAALFAEYVRAADAYIVFMRCTVCGSRGKAFSTWVSPLECEWGNAACDNARSAWNMRAG